MQFKDTVPSLYKQLLRERHPKLDNFDIDEVSNTLETMKKHEALLQALPENTFASLVEYIHHKRDIANKSLIVGKIINQFACHHRTRFHPHQRDVWESREYFYDRHVLISRHMFTTSPMDPLI